MADQMELPSGDHAFMCTWLEAYFICPSISFAVFLIFSFFYKAALHGWVNWCHD